jgi:hypothetical protein
LLREPAKDHFSDHAGAMEKYALWSQGLYRLNSLAPAGGAFFEVKYEGMLGEARGRYLLVSDDAEKIQYVAIQGTGTVQDLAVGAALGPTWDEELRMDLHRGFRRLALAVRKDLLPRLKDGYKVGLGGHSAGGAAAEILAMYLKTVDKKSVAEIYTFGQPKLTNDKGLRAPASLAQRTVRVINCEDAIPLLPHPTISSFWLSGGYQHGGPVIFLARDGRVWFSREDVELDAIPLITRTILSDLIAEKPFQGHAIETYLERIRGAKGDAKETDYEGKTAGICDGL